MYSKMILFVAFVSALVCGSVFADGKFYYREDVSAELPFQRAAIFHEDGIETLVVQSRYAADVPKDAADIAWVVPVPNEPELIDVRYDASNLFFFLSFAARPNVIWLGKQVAYWLYLFLVFYLVRRYLKIRKSSRSDTAKAKVLFEGLLAVFVIFILGLLLPSLGVPKGHGVDVINAKKVGVYDVKVIRGDSANAIIQWFDDNGFTYDSEDQQVFEKYVQDKWCFVTAKIHEDIDPETDIVFYGSMTAPLCLRFDAYQPVYPMSLTATASTQTEVVLYLLTDSKMQCGGRLEMDYFGSDFEPRIRLAGEDDSEYLYFNSKTFKVTRFHSKLNPEQMAEDIIFTKASEQTPFRPTKIKWWR